MTPLEVKYQAAIKLLAEWCDAVDTVGTGWDDWDEHYKDAAYRPSILREDIDKALAQIKADEEAVKNEWKNFLPKDDPDYTGPK